MTAPSTQLLRPRLHCPPWSPRRVPPLPTPTRSSDPRPTPSETELLDVTWISSSDGFSSRFHSNSEPWFPELYPARPRGGEDSLLPVLPTPCCSLCALCHAELGVRVFFLPNPVLDCPVSTGLPVTTSSPYINSRNSTQNAPIISCFLVGLWSVSHHKK